MPQQGLRAGQAVEPGGVHQYMAHHGRAVTRVLDLPAAVINVYLEMDIIFWPVLSLFDPIYIVKPAVGHMCVALGQLDFGIVEDHAWASTVRSARNPAQSSATMGRRQFLSSSTAGTAERANSSGVARNGLDR